MRGDGRDERDRPRSGARACRGAVPSSGRSGASRRLDALAADAERLPGEVAPVVADLEREDDVNEATRSILAQDGRRSMSSSTRPERSCSAGSTRCRRRASTACTA